MLGPMYINKIPLKLYNLIQEKREMEYSPVYKKEIPLEKQNVSIDTITFIAILHYNYWCNDIEEKRRLDKLFSDNENKYQMQLKEQFNPDVFAKKREEQEKIITKEIEPKKEMLTGMTIYKKENIFTKIINKIKNIFGLKK